MSDEYVRCLSVLHPLNADIDCLHYIDFFLSHFLGEPLKVEITWWHGSEVSDE